METLHSAAKKGDYLTTSMLLLRGKRPGTRDEGTKKPIFLAVCTPQPGGAGMSSLKTLVALLNAGARADTTCEDGDLGRGTTVMHWAASAGQTDCVMALCDIGAPNDEKAEEGSTPIEVAYSEREYDCVSILLDAGARSLDWDDIRSKSVDAVHLAYGEYKPDEFTRKRSVIKMAIAIAEERRRYLSDDAVASVERRIRQNVVQLQNQSGSNWFPDWEDPDEAIRLLEDDFRLRMRPFVTGDAPLPIATFKLAFARVKAEYSRQSRDIDTIQAVKAALDPGLLARDRDRLQFIACKTIAIVRARRGELADPQSRKLKVELAEMWVEQMQESVMDARTEVEASLEALRQAAAAMKLAGETGADDDDDENDYDEGEEEEEEEDEEEEEVEKEGLEWEGLPRIILSDHAKLIRLRRRRGQDPDDSEDDESSEEEEEAEEEEESGDDDEDAVW